ncbi:unnamed protein product [Rodentolepis nana]|uniref:Uncharacterized protein n=1 Tax=Rodentolepis nana TaxID=102285 RepID=A0A0R3T359_RODNA|nr:unnamed protein product [Rodentolepis nana]
MLESKGDAPVPTSLLPRVDCHDCLKQHHRDIEMKHFATSSREAFDGGKLSFKSSDGELHFSCLLLLPLPSCQRKNSVSFQGWNSVGKTHIRMCNSANGLKFLHSPRIIIRKQGTPNNLPIIRGTTICSNQYNPSH